MSSLLFRVVCAAVLVACIPAIALCAGPEFTPLFDGASLSGWIGDTSSYEVLDGTLASKPDAAGKIYTKEHYGDFVLRFDFKLTAGANNGIALRAPGKGDPAYEAMESQVLDDTADVYKDLEDYQFHGSIYGVAPAKRGFLKPVGQWNHEEIRCKGPRVKVTLNGEVTVDVDLTKVAPAGKTIDKKDHPGLMREAGHIGLLGHGARVYFRNIEVHRLSE